jgi:guanosine-3',5'-bis(diphosphate) 3'-pyrophosphohydrolase
MESAQQAPAAQISDPDGSAGADESDPGATPLLVVVDASPLAVVPVATLGHDLADPQLSDPLLSDPLFAPLAERLAGYLDGGDIARIAAAYRFSAEVHEGQHRASGEPYIVHPLAVAAIVADWHLDTQALIAALLHDVVEDTCISKAEIAERFGAPVAELVDGLTKLDKLKFRTREDADAASFQKMLLAMSRDLRVILIKLADRLHNMRTLFAVLPEKRRRISQETLDIYAPIANRLGLNNVCHELEDLAFANRYPWRHQVLAQALAAVRGDRRRDLLTKFHHDVETLLPKWDVDADVQGREKQLYRIYQKMAEKKKADHQKNDDHEVEAVASKKRSAFARVHDIYGFRLIVADVRSCYLALGALHSSYQPIPGRFKDYIAIPRVNRYQSLHTTLIGPGGVSVEVQIRTREMHCVAELGLAAHWRYKLNDNNITAIQQKSIAWSQVMLELQMNSGGGGEFFEHLKANMAPDEIFVISPKGKIFNLPRGATPVDFAYAVHTEVGHYCSSCRINADFKPINTELKTGDQVEIITSAYPNVSLSWLNYVRTGLARAKIRHFMKNRQQDEAVTLGEKLLNVALRPHGYTVGTISSPAWERFLRERGVKSERDIFADIGLGDRMPVVVARRLLLAEARETGAAKLRGGGMPCFKIHGGEGATVLLAHCCQPIPDDPVIGIFSRGKGLEIHRKDCPVISHVRGDRGRWVDAAWEADAARLFDVTLRIRCRGGHGMLVRIANTIGEEDCNIQSAVVEQAHPETSGTVLDITVQVRNRTHLAQIMRRVHRVAEVVRVTRAQG